MQDECYLCEVAKAVLERASRKFPIAIEEVCCFRAKVHSRPDL